MQLQPLGGRGGHKCVRRILKESSNNGVTAPPDEHQLAVKDFCYLKTYRLSRKSLDG